jgi:GT2 family glycosyltransferase
MIIIIYDNNNNKSECMQALANIHYPSAFVDKYVVCNTQYENYVVIIQFI